MKTERLPVIVILNIFLMILIGVCTLILNESIIREIRGLLAEIQKNAKQGAGLIYNQLPPGHYSINTVLNEADHTALVEHSLPLGERLLIINEVPPSLLTAGAKFQIFREESPTVLRTMANGMDGRLR